MPRGLHLIPRITRKHEESPAVPRQSHEAGPGAGLVRAVRTASR
jgi:hypothetical protein